MKETISLLLHGSPFLMPKNRIERTPLRVLFADVFQDFAGGVVTGSAGDTVAGMRAVAAEKKAGDRRGVARPTQQRAHGENLIER
jgi:hypothetical protein